LEETLTFVVFVAIGNGQVRYKTTSVEAVFQDTQLRKAVKMKASPFKTKPTRGAGKVKQRQEKQEATNKSVHEAQADRKEKQGGGKEETLEELKPKAATPTGATGALKQPTGTAGDIEENITPEELQKQEEAAIKIQAVARGNLQRKKQKAFREPREQGKQNKARAEEKGKDKEEEGKQRPKKRGAKPKEEEEKKRKEANQKEKSYQAAKANHEFSMDDEGKIHYLTLEKVRISCLIALAN